MSGVDDTEEDRLKTAAENKKRRGIRGQHKEAHLAIQNNRDELENFGTGLLIETADNLNKICGEITHPREQGDDAVMFKEISGIFHTIAIKMDDPSRRYDYSSWVSSLTKKFNDSSTNFSWSNLGHDVGSLFLTAPSVSVMLGPMSRPIIKRKAMEKKGPKTAHVAVEPEEIEQTLEEDDEATNERIQVLKKYVLSLCYPNSFASGNKKKKDDDEESQSFDLLSRLVDPEDPVQTIENLFDFAFLIKEKEVIQGWMEDKKTVIAKHGDPNYLSTIPKRQMVLSLGMKDLRTISGMIKDKNLKENNTPNCFLHRNDALYHAKNAIEQCEILAKRAGDKKQKVSVKNGDTDRNIDDNKDGNFNDDEDEDRGEEEEKGKGKGRGKKSKSSSSSQSTSSKRPKREMLIKN